MVKVFYRGDTQMENPNYYAVIPAKVRYDDRLRPNEKLLYGEIGALSNKDGKCWATNSYFAKVYKVGTSTISTWINDLADKGYVLLRYFYKGTTKEIEKREIQLTDVLSTHEIGVHKNEIGIHKKIRGYSQNPKENNTSMNKEEEEKENIKEKVEMNDEDFKKVINFYENNMTLITPTVSEDIEKYLYQNNVHADLIIACIKEAVDRNKRFWKYAASILNDCVNNKIFTAEQFYIRQKEFKSNNKSAKKQTDEKVEYEEITYTEEEYSKMIRDN